MDKLNLSYSKMQIYNKCAFRYYLTDVLKLDVFEENFSTIIGSMVHYVLEKCLSNNNRNIDIYVNEYLNGRVFTNKEKFFLEKYKVCIGELLEQIDLEKEFGSFDNALYEKKIVIDYGNNIKFTGIIDKVLYKETNDNTYVTLIDYKTGNDDINLKYLHHGINMQLPIYLYLSNYLNFRNVFYSGFYLQKFNITDKDYRLVGYSNSDRDILSIIDNNYDNSKIIKGMKTNKDGSFSRYAKVFNNDDMNKIVNITGEKILEVIDNIKNNRFDINPKINGDKNIGCEYCKFKDICFVTKKDKVEIVECDFGGNIDGMD
jgi:ATP-dependent helicase/nuclease subunit B